MSLLRRVSILSVYAAALVACTDIKRDTRPNILLIVADDLGYADLGCSGGDIRTPTIDRLASSGLLFTQFHTAPTCAPTRAMLLSGNNNHVAGMGRQGGAPKGSWIEGKSGYEGFLSDRVVPMPILLQDAGYHTYTVGKWHLGKKPEHSPARKGFERSFNLLQGGGNHYNSIGILGTDSVSQYSADGVLTDYPEGKYSTEFYTDKLVEFIRSGNNDKPFFAYAAYTSPHWPLQIPPEFDRYKGKYDMGYDSLRALRLESLKRTGIISKDHRLPPRLESIKPWSELTPAEKKVESRKMELYAGMLDNLDYHIGRLIQFLADEGLYENTLIIFMSDNGAAAEDFYQTPPYSNFIAPRYNNSLENMGTATSFVSYGPQWAKAGAAPFGYHKGYTTEGGIVAPMIISGAGVVGSGQIRKEFVTVMDIAPTVLELAKAPYPGSYEAPIVRPMLGESMLSYLLGKADAVHDSTYVTGLEQGGRAYFRKGKWKIVNVEGPHLENTFQLFNMELDPAETTNLAIHFPNKFNEMIKGWRDYREANGILIEREETAGKP